MAGRVLEAGVGLRGELDTLGYREPLPPDALPLVRRVLQDLKKTKEEERHCKALLAETREKCDVLEASVGPYQEENGRLLTQINKLHMANLRLREQNEKHDKELENAVEKLAEENGGLQLLVGEYQRKIEQLEAESRKKGEKILQLQERNLRAVVTTPGGGKRPIPQQRQRLEITSTLLPHNSNMSSFKCSNCGCTMVQGPSTSNNNKKNNNNDSNKSGYNHHHHRHDRDSNTSDSNKNNNSDNNDLYLADLLRMTDHKLLELQREVEQSQRHARQYENECVTLKKQISGREAEISRLEGLLEGGRSAAAVVRDNRLHAAQAHLHQLQLHNDLLTKTNLQLENKLKNTLGETHEAMTRAVELADENTDLTHDLQDAESTHRLLEEDALSTAQTLSHRLHHTRSKLAQCEGDLSEQHRLYHLIRDERDRLHGELVHTRHQLSRLTHEHTRLLTQHAPLEEQLRKGQEETKTHLDRINLLTLSLQEAEGEKRHLSADGEALRKTIVELKAQKEALNRSLAQVKEEREAATQGKEFYAAETEKLGRLKGEVEQERDYYKEESAKYQSQSTSMEQERDLYREKSAELEREKQLLEQSRSFLGDDVAKLQSQLRQVQQERDYFTDQLNHTQGEKRQAEREREYYSEQVVQLLDLLKTKPSSTPSTPMQVSRPRPKTHSPETELARLQYERDVFRQERDFYKMQYQSLKSQQEVGSGGSLISGSPPGATVTTTGVPTTAATTTAAAAPPTTLGPTTTTTAGGVPGVGPVAGSPRGVGAPGAPPPRPLSVPIGAADVEAIRKERDFFRQQMEYFRQQAQTTRAAPVVPGLGMAMDSDRASVRGPLTRGSSEPSPPLDISEPSATALRGELRAYQQERDFYKQQYENLKASMAQPHPQARGAEEVDLSGLLRERDTLQQEKDFFRSQYNDLSRRMAQLTSTGPAISQTLRQEMETLMAEKRGANIARADLESQVRILTERLGEAEREKAEIDAHTRDLHTAIEKLQDAATQRFPPSTQAFILEVRKARDAAMSDLEKVKKERDQLRERLRALTSQQVREKATLEEEASSQRRLVEEGGRTATELQQRLNSQSALVASLQDQAQNLQAALQQAHDQLGLQGKESEEVKRLLQQKVGEMGDAEQQLGLRLKELSAREERLRELEGELARVRGELADCRAEVTGLRASMARLDHDKDLLSAELDSKTEGMASLREELRKREALVAQLEASVTRLEGRLEASVSAATAAERRGDRLQQDLVATTQARDAANKEIRRLHKELMGLTQEHKNLREELDKCITSKDNFKKKAQEYCRTLEEMTHVMASKDTDQSALRKQYLSLKETVSSLNSLNASLEEAATTRQQEVNKMEQLMAKFKEEREQLISQVMEASQRSDALEEECRKLEQEKYNVEKDLLATRDMAHKLDTRRGQAESEVVRLSAMLQKETEERRGLEHQVETLAGQLSGERSAVRSLEETLNQKRRTEWSSEASIKQLEVEKSQLQRKISELESQLEDEVRETKRLRTQAAELEAELERRKRELTDERFERERASQELRRVQRFRSVTRALDALDSGSPATTTTTTTQGTGPPQVALTSSPPHPSPPQRRSASESPRPGPSAHQEEQGGVARAPSVPLHSSSSDTGLERSQGVSSSSDSHHEPWRLAFGSRNRLGQPPSASQESVALPLSSQSHRATPSPLREALTLSAAASTLPSHSQAQASPLSSSVTRPIRKGPSFSQITTSSPCSPRAGTITTAPSSLGPSPGPSPASSHAPLPSVRPKDRDQQHSPSHTDPDSSP